jgi:hypothetical protein
MKEQIAQLLLAEKMRKRAADMPSESLRDQFDEEVAVGHCATHTQQLLIDDDGSETKLYSVSTVHHMTTMVATAQMLHIFSIRLNHNLTRPQLVMFFFSILEIQ